MAKDVLFKTMTFGGFNKEDVLEYIRAQQTQLTDTQRKLKENEENAAAASKRTRELKLFFRSSRLVPRNILR